MFTSCCIELPEVRFGSTTGVGDNIDLLEVFTPVQSYLSSKNPNCINFY